MINIKKFRKYILVLVAIFAVGMMTSCSNKKDELQLATKPVTEGFILSEILAILIEDNTDLEVEITKGIGGGTGNIHPALLKGDFDLYSEYTGTSWNFILKKEEIPDDDTLYRELVKEYKEKFDLQWVGLYGFNNTFGIVVRKEIAEKYDLKTYSDLAKVSDKLIFGSEYDFYGREDGYDGLVKEYGMDFKETKDMDIGLKYNAINNKEVDVINVFTTDGMLAESDVVVLEDDKAFYENYYCGTIIRSDTLEKHPELKDVLMMMEDLITDAEMAEMNYKVEGEGMEDKDVAREFLIEKGLIDE